jgi:hypothetical protein
MSGTRPLVGCAPLACAGLLLALAGCSGIDRNVDRVDSAVSPVTVGEPANVAATDLARVMLQAGFSPQQILDQGPGVRNSLALTGGAQVQEGGQIVALFSIMDGQLYVSSQTRGTIVHPLTS